MAQLFNLPKMGQTMEEGVILQWLKQEGDAIEDWEPVLELETDKVNMEVETQLKGIILKLLYDEGDIVPVGTPVAVIGEADEDISELLASLKSAAPATAPSPERKATPAAPVSSPATASVAPSTIPGEIPAVSPRARELAASIGVDWHTLHVTGQGVGGMLIERDVQAMIDQGALGPTRQSPLAAKMADAHGLSLRGVPGSGPSSRVMAADVRRLLERPAGMEAREIRLTGMRKIIAERLTISYQDAVHVPLRVDADMTTLIALRARIRDEFNARHQTKLTFTDFIAAAIARSLVETPELNATLEDDVLHLHPGVNLGLAVALEEGLVVPVLRDAQTLTLGELSAALTQLAEQARARQLKADAFAGGSFTLTNLGQFGIDSFDPIINPPQVAILGVGAIADRVVAREGVPAVRSMMTLTLTFDHRATDGAPASRLLMRIKELLESPEDLLS